jgi:serine/threonine protein kinase
LSAASRPSAGSGSEGRRGSADLPEKINRYVVKRLLGKGGQGAVYHAYDPNLAIDVAVKVLHPDFRSEEFIDRIRAEARTAVRLTAPNVVRVYDFDEQYPYLVMEYCGDGDLNHYLKMRRRRSLAEIASITGQICDALIAAHEHDPPILHRDLKPGNVLFQKQTPKVADFGLAKMLGGGTGLTTTRGVMGTVRYCSPEQLRDASKVDQRTDIWAAGVVLYELLTWMRPFDKPGDSFVSVAVRVHTESPRQPPYEIPAPLMGVILRALEKDADKRYRSAREMRQALDEALRAIPGAADIMLPPEEVVDDRSQKAAQVASLLDAGRSQDAATIVQAIRRSDPDDSLGVYWQRRVKEVSQEGASSSPGQGVSGGAAEEPGGIAQQLGSIQSLIQSRQYREARQRIGELILQAPRPGCGRTSIRRTPRPTARAPPGTTRNCTRSGSG